MRTNIEIDDKLMSDALRLTGLKTKKEAVELGLRTLVRLRQQEELRRFRGKLQWEGDLNAMRTDSETAPHTKNRTSPPCAIIRAST